MYWLDPRDTVRVCVESASSMHKNLIPLPLFSSAVYVMLRDYKSI